MKQYLLVEGKNDLHVISSLFKKLNVNWPKGITREKDFEKFFKGGKGIDNLMEKSLPTALREEGVTNIGIVIDANSKGPTARSKACMSVLQKFGYQLKEIKLHKNGTIIEIENLPKIGIWIMPNNKNKGAIEDFLKVVIPSDDKLLSKASDIMHDLKQNKLARFKAKDQSKALIHTWLAWQEKPGLPYGQAINSKYFDLKNLLITDFVDWFQNTFELQEATTHTMA